MSEYINRVVDNELAEQLEASGAVLIVGPKWCGKTTTASRQSRSIIKLQDVKLRSAYLQMADTAPMKLLEGDTPRLIDEWQEAPILWDAVRTAVDERGEDGQFILTGSTVVEDKNKEIRHTGTGRIARVVMYPMSLYESGESNGSVSISRLFDEPTLDLAGARSDLGLDELVFAACRGGWPSSLAKKSDGAKLRVARNYIDAICNIDASRVDGVERDSSRVRAVMLAYARNISTLAADSTVLEDVRANFGDFSDKTLASYKFALERLFVIEDVPAWCPAIRSKTAIRASHKKEFTDPSMAATALGASPQKLISDLQTFGFIFETLCIRDLRAYTSAIGGNLSYYRDRYGLESDCVLHLPDGRFALIEFKLGNSQIEEGASHLVQIRDLVREANAKNSGIRIDEPTVMMVVTGGELAYTRKDGVHVVPIGCLKP